LRHASGGALKKAFEIGLIEDGDNWMKLLNDRNTTSHAYDEATLIQLKS
jgi:hypothetical protein